MDIRILSVLLLIGIVGSFSQAEAAVRRARNDEHPVFAPLPELLGARTKRAVGGPNGETTPSEPQASQAPASSTTNVPQTSSSSTSSTNEPGTPSTTNDPKTPSTTGSPANTTPASATAPAESTVTASSATAKSTGKPKKSLDSGKPTSTEASVASRFGPDSEDPDKKAPEDHAPSSGAGDAGFGPYYGSNYGAGFDSGYSPYFGYPAFNSIPGSGRNYAWTNNGPGMSSAAAGSFTGFGGPGGVPNVGTRGGFADNMPEFSPYWGGVGPFGGIDPGFNPAFNANRLAQQHFEMVRAQIAAQIEAQNRMMMANRNRMANMRQNMFRPPNYVYFQPPPPSMMPTPPPPPPPTRRIILMVKTPDDDEGSPNAGGGVPNSDTNPSAFGSGTPNLGGNIPNSADSSDPGFPNPNQLGSGGYSTIPGPQYAGSSIQIGPGGGHQMGEISPAAPGIESRFAEDLPAPSGNSYGVFASSSSSTVVGPDGKQISQKSSTTGVNDNGKITYRTVHD